MPPPTSPEARGRPPDKIRARGQPRAAEARRRIGTTVWGPSRRTGSLSRQTPAPARGREDGGAGAPPAAPPRGVTLPDRDLLGRPTGRTNKPATGRARRWARARRRRADAA